MCAAELGPDRLRDLIRRAFADPCPRVRGAAEWFVADEDRRADAATRADLRSLLVAALATTSDPVTAGVRSDESALRIAALLCASHPADDDALTAWDAEREPDEDVRRIATRLAAAR